ncbi:uncharacterized protein C8R40DRAFT_640967 [Lentinula edodes]|uniref:uncharacterized protein n=1 Tax=Lentinula edodes TaxID=5353 RepID=UPI001E8E343D|nr:uncharacterized protein C8R40DRAFT_640967 [Lentinula edodes]KAH7870508.1 hypothetical protein C8R40DRAFT_640967 [Lentinula edodes]
MSIMINTGVACLERGPPTIPSDASRITQLLRTNEPPTEEEEEIFRFFVKSGRSYLRDLDIRIALMKGSLHEMEKMKGKLGPEVSRYKYSLGAMRRMPLDVLEVIFRFGAGYFTNPEDFFSSTTHCLDIKSPPWIYARVCRRWKDIVVYKIPSLWTRVKFDLGKIRDSPSRRIPMALSLLSIYLSRSSALPLIVYIDMFSAPASPDLVGFALRLVAAHSRRWQSLFLVGGQGIDTKILSGDSLMSLENIQIQESSMEAPRSLDIAASQLRAWSAVGNLLSTYVQITPPTSLCRQITEYSISTVMYTEVHKILPLLPNIRKLSVQDILNSNNPPTSELRLPYLREFNIRQQNNPLATFLPTDGLVALIDSISCPALTHLSVSVYGIFGDAFKRFERRSNFKLQHLIAGEGAGILVKGLQNRLALETIEIRGFHFYTSVIEVITHLHVPPALTPVALSMSWSPATSNSHSNISPPVTPFPNLRRFQFQLSLLPFMDIMEKLHACVSSRRSGSAAPLEILVAARDGQARTMLGHPRLKDLRSMGAKVEITST